MSLSIKKWLIVEPATDIRYILVVQIVYIRGWRDFEGENYTKKGKKKKNFIDCTKARK